ncbi:MAG TPA: hypothetical protein VMT85_00295 [Thermoanaerobaculia bacterium]|nr:hypothetical protein [Thermoanaerobaculia bacterium]
MGRLLVSGLVIETLDLARSLLELRFDDPQELQAFLERARIGRSIVRLEQRLDEGVEIDLVLQSDGTRWVVPARVQQVFRSGADRFGIMLEVLSWDTQPTVALSASQTAPPADGEPEPQAEPAADAAETTGTSVQFEIRALNPSQRALLATKANRTQRQILLRESSPQVQMALLNNPHIEPKEILELAKNSQTVAPVLQRIAGEQRYLQSHEIRVALVKHPNTPTPLALRMIEGMRTQDLRVLAKGQAVREAVRGAALRAYLRRQ